VTEVERLQKIVKAQEFELRNLRRLLSMARVAGAEFDVVDGKLSVIVTAVGVDEYYFTEQTKPELLRIAEALLQQRTELKSTDVITDAATGEPITGGVAPLGMEPTE
jgi:hypothetical protein